ncbi:MAG TPA: hypothetical protein VGK04_02030 [Thermoanaerobaculia bacterium]|jgi:hypothetical protein
MAGRKRGRAREKKPATQDPLARVIERARRSAEFFHRLVFDPEKALAELDYLDRRMKGAILSIDPDALLGLLLFPAGPVAGCGDSCGFASCTTTCGKTSCQKTCTDSCGNTCGEKSCTDTVAIFGGGGLVIGGIARSARRR